MHDHVKFRLRGREVSRVEAFSDVVFGFALTLIVVSLEVPTRYEELVHTMRGFPAFAEGPRRRCSRPANRVICTLRTHAKRRCKLSSWVHFPLTSRRNY